MNVGERLSEVMKRNGVSSAKQLAGLSGVSQTMISKILRGDSYPTTQTLDLLCAAMGLSLADFYKDDAKADDDELWEIREELRRRPEMRVLFSATKKATKEDLLRAIKIIEALKEESGNE